MPHCCCLVHFDDEIHKLWWGLALSDLMFHRFWIFSSDLLFWYWSLSHIFSLCYRDVSVYNYNSNGCVLHVTCLPGVTSGFCTSCLSFFSLFLLLCFCRWFCSPYHPFSRISLGLWYSLFLIFMEKSLKKPNG
jgi:hypothetical protein